ncbi:MAG: hypothetical protein HY690_07180 [Chloroflexi bacterium]|nr:hypothetical protein [Chloroflexota bacterium]
MAEIRFVDTTIRDGQQSLWANDMRMGMILPIAEQPLVALTQELARRTDRGYIHLEQASVSLTLMRER